MRSREESDVAGRLTLLRNYFVAMSERSRVSVSKELFVGTDGTSGEKTFDRMCCRTSRCADPNGGLP